VIRNVVHTRFLGCMSWIAFGSGVVQHGRLDPTATRWAKTSRGVRCGRIQSEPSSKTYGKPRQEQSSNLRTSEDGMIVYNAPGKDFSTSRIDAV
jgi:hypothetical protein